MKNISFILFIGLTFSLSISSCSKKTGCMDPDSLNYDSSAQEDDGSCNYLVAKQHALILKTTSTGCSYCGEWGAEYTDHLLTNFEDLDFIAIYSSPFQANISIALKKELDYIGTPHFWLGNQDLVNNISSISYKVSTVLSQEPEVGIRVSHSLSGSKMKIKVITQREGNSNSDYNLAVYILEDHQIARQSIKGEPSDPNWEHNHILRREVSGLIYGQPIASTSTVTSNFEIDLGELELLSENIVPKNCYPLAVIWRNDAGNFSYVNSNH